MNNFIQDQVQRCRVKHINHLQQGNYIYTELAGRCVYIRKPARFATGSLNAGGTFSAFSIASDLFPSPLGTFQPPVMVTSL